ncbi:MAG: LLM class flavin-dependent oxidoreductase [Acidimicrobiia bacterium]|nr:LLM class flavin-dependent oxidoreductase [Acidimicrobiia bacterium]
MADRLAFGIGVGSQPPASASRWMLRLAKGLRLDSAWAVDHFMGWFPTDLWDRRFTWLARGGSPHAFFNHEALLGRLAPHAGKVRLGVGVTESIRRHPVAVAQFAMTLSHFTSQPPILGLGAGERENVEPYGMAFDTPVGRLEEAVRIIRTCFTSNGPFEFRGEHFSMPDALMDLAPKEGNTPEIWVAAHGPRMLRITGQYADGWYPVYTATPGEYASGLHQIHTAAAQAGRAPSDITPALQLPFIVGKSRSAARRMLDHPAVRYLGLLTPASAWKVVGEEHPFGPSFRGVVDFIPHRHDPDEIRAALDAIPDRVMERSAAWGTVDDVADVLGDFVDAGLRHVVLTPVSGLVSRREAVRAVRAIRTLRAKLG